jgi:hypothetical protein
MSASILRFSRHRQDDHLRGAAIIDEHGREIPITEPMIQLAIQSLLQGDGPSGAAYPDLAPAPAKTTRPGD